MTAHCAVGPMNFATWSIRNPIPAILLFAMLTFAGIWGFRALPIQNFPDVDLPRVTVTLFSPAPRRRSWRPKLRAGWKTRSPPCRPQAHPDFHHRWSRLHHPPNSCWRRISSDALIETKDAVDRVRSDLPTTCSSPRSAP